MWMVIGALGGRPRSASRSTADGGAVVLGLFAGFVGWAKDRHGREPGAAATSRPTGARCRKLWCARCSHAWKRSRRGSPGVERAAGAEPRRRATAAPCARRRCAVARSDAAAPRAARRRRDTANAAAVPRRTAMRVPPPPAGLPVRRDRRRRRPQAPSPALPARLATRCCREWLAGGNTLTRVGIVILFFGVAFLLRYFAEIVTVPIEAKLAARRRSAGSRSPRWACGCAARVPRYGLSLEGAGMGIVYLTVFAAFRLYDVLPPLPAIVLLVAIAALTVALALRARFAGARGARASRAASSRRS